jgi:hypothetical protein
LPRYIVWELLLQCESNDLEIQDTFDKIGIYKQLYNTKITIVSGSCLLPLISSWFALLIKVWKITLNNIENNIESETGRNHHLSLKIVEQLEKHQAHNHPINHSLKWSSLLSRAIILCNWTHATIDWLSAAPNVQKYSK